MLKKFLLSLLCTVVLVCALPACAQQNDIHNSGNEETVIYDTYTTSTPIASVISDPVFGNYGRLIFPVDEWYYSGDTLGDLSMTWYTHIDPNKTVEICNYLKSQVAGGQKIFYDIYTDEEKAADPSLEDTGLFFFKGNEGAPFARDLCRRRFCLRCPPCTTVFRTHWSFPNAAIMPLPSSIAPAGRRLTKI